MFMKIELICEDETKGPVIVDYSMPIDHIKSGFCLANPRIGSFARQNPRTMALTIMFVISTIMRNWVTVKNSFVHLVDYADRLGSLPERYPEDAPFKSVVVSSYPNIREIWNNREAVYDELMPLLDRYDSASDESEKWMAVYELYKVLNSYPNLRQVKAGFAVQMLIGRLGCLDSNNLIVFREKLSEPQYKKFARPDAKGNIEIPDIKSPRPRTPIGRELVGNAETKLRAYMKFLQDIKQSGDSNESQRLWDMWTILISHKILIRMHEKDDGPRKIITHHQGYEAEVDPYGANPEKAGNRVSDADLEKYIAKYGKPDPHGIAISKQHMPLEHREIVQKSIRKLLA